MITSAQEYREVVLELLPEQGRVSETDYLWLTNHATRLLEFTDGYIEVLPIPSNTHQGIVLFFIRALLPHVDTRGSILRFAPLRLRLRVGKFREPDLMILLDANDPRVTEPYWLGAEMILEVISPDRPERDLVEKRREYAEAGIPEYWIVNPLDQSSAVLRLEGGTYGEHGIFTAGMKATSSVLPHVSVAVDEVFAA